jgi:hypothetical protein
MFRTTVLTLALLAAGCVLPPERQALQPLPDNAPPLTYTEASARARAQASVAVESFYVDNWAALEEAGKALEQTARVLTKATEVPARHRDTLTVEAGDLGKEALRLQEVSRKKDVKEVNDALQRINLKVRELAVDR